MAMSRWKVEATFAGDWGMDITGKKKTIPHQYLNKVDLQLAPEVFKLGVIFCASMVIKNRFHILFKLTFPLPP